MTEQAETEVRAKEMGWVPREEFRGDPEKWIDAAQYVERGETLLPIVQANNRRLTADIRRLEDKLREANETIQASAEAIETLREFNSAENRRAMKERRDETKKALIAAKEANDHAAEVELTQQLTEESAALRAAEAGATEKEEKPEKKPSTNGKVSEEDYTKTPEWQSWAAENPWFGADRRKSAMAMAIADEVRNNPDTKNLRGKAFLDKVSEEVASFFGEKTTPQTRKVEGGTRGGSSKEDGGGQTYYDLPADAKAACERMAPRLVGKGRAYETVDAWRKHYAKEFFDQEA